MPQHPAQPGHHAALPWQKPDLEATFCEEVPMVARKLTEAEIEAIEDAEDLAAIEAWEEEKRLGTAKTIPLADILKKYGMKPKERSAA
jgi:hypothetical protein